MPIDFYTADIPGEHALVVRATFKDGRIGYQEKEIRIIEASN